MQKRKIATLGYVGLAALIIVGQMAFANSPQDGAPRERGGRRGPDIDQRVENLTKKLQLSDEQKSQVRTLFTDQQKQRQEMRQDSSLSREDRFAKMRTMNQTIQTEMAKILNTDQMKKWDKMMKEERERRRERREGSGPGPGDGQ